MKDTININLVKETEKYHKYKNILSTIKSELLKFLKSTGINDVVIWVSWWIDSAVDLAIASQVLEPNLYL